MLVLVTKICRDFSFFMQANMGIISYEILLRFLTPFFPIHNQLSSKILHCKYNLEFKKNFSLPNRHTMKVYWGIEATIHAF